MARKKGWSKEARSKGKGAEYSAVKKHKKEGHFAMRIDSDKQKGELRSIDYIVVLDGIAGQAKYQRQYLMSNSTKAKEERARINEFASKYGLKKELAYRGARYQRIKFESLK